jgi:hypothetical protein
VRDAVFGLQGWDDVVHLAVLVVWGVVLWRVAIRAMTQKLID